MAGFLPVSVERVAVRPGFLPGVETAAAAADRNYLRHTATTSVLCTLPTGEYKETSTNTWQHLPLMLRGAGKQAALRSSTRFDVLQGGDDPLLLVESLINNGDDRNIVGVWVQGRACK
jgi:hypothetical protein